MAHHWVLVRLERVRRGIKPADFKLALEEVLPYVDDACVEESLREFKSDALQFVVNFTDGGNSLEPLLATEQWYEPAAALGAIKASIDAAIAEATDKGAT
jgi:hypothetical protein